MALKLQVKREPVFSAPRKPLALQCQNLAYCSGQGGKMIMTRVGVDTQGFPVEQWGEYYIDNNQRFVSCDHGRSWQEHGPVVLSGPYKSGKAQNAWMYFRDPDNGLMVALFCRTVRFQGTNERNTKIYYEISRDEGNTWTPPRQVIHPGPEYNAEHWMPGITCKEQEVSADQAPFAKTGDGSIVCGFSSEDVRGIFGVSRCQSSTVFLIGRWNKDRTDILWDISRPITVPETVGNGCVEPDMMQLDSRRLFATMRCQGNEGKGIYSSRQCSLSEDGGKTWSEPWAFKYDDGSQVCVPASISAFERDPETGRIFWFANILDRPVYGQVPRYPLAMAELDPEKLCLIKDSVTVIQPRPEGFPENTRYSNFGHYVDRQTGELVILIEEEFWFTGKFKTNYQTDDYCSLRIKVCR